MVLGIVGSRKILLHQCSHIITKFLFRYRPHRICSGGARGVDSHAEFIANRLQIHTIIHLPDWSQGMHAGFVRNSYIAQDSDVVVAIYPGSYASGGTKDTAKKALKLGKIVHEVFLCLSGYK